MYFLTANKVPVKEINKLIANCITKIYKIVKKLTGGMGIVENWCLIKGSTKGSKPMKRTTENKDEIKETKKV